MVNSLIEERLKIIGQRMIDEHGADKNRDNPTLEAVGKYLAGEDLDG